MLHLSADLAYTHVKQCSDPSTNGVSANAALVSGFGVHSCENTALANLPTVRLQMLHLSADLAYTHVKHGVGEVPSVCKSCTCQRIWRTLT